MPDRTFENMAEDIETLSASAFPVLDSAAGEKMKEAILAEEYEVVE